MWDRGNAEGALSSGHWEKDTVGVWSRSPDSTRISAEQSFITDRSSPVILKSTNRNSAQNPMHTATWQYGKRTVLGNTKQWPQLETEDGRCGGQLPLGCPKGQRSRVAPTINHFFIPLNSPTEASVQRTQQLHQRTTAGSCKGSITANGALMICLIRLICLRGIKNHLCSLCVEHVTLELPVRNDNLHWYRHVGLIKMASSKADASQKQNNDPACFYIFGTHHQARAMGPRATQFGSHQAKLLQFILPLSK